MEKYWVMRCSQHSPALYRTPYGKWTSRDTVERASFTNEEAIAVSRLGK